MPWYRSGVLCNSQTSRRPVGDDGDFHIIPRSWRVLVGTIVGIGGHEVWRYVIGKDEFEPGIH